MDGRTCNVFSVSSSMTRGAVIEDGEGVRHRGSHYGDFSYITKCAEVIDTHDALWRREGDITCLACLGAE